MRQAINEQLLKDLAEAAEAWGNKRPCVVQAQAAIKAAKGE